LVGKKIRAQYRQRRKNFDPCGSRATAFKEVDRFRRSVSAFDQTKFVR
jgi:hypothetical protein